MTRKTTSEVIRAADANAIDLLFQIENGLSASLTVDVFLDRAKNSLSMGANIHIAYDSARLSAIACDEQQYIKITSSLHGLPIVVKDNIDVAGMPSTAGSPLLAGNIPAKSASVIQKLLNAGVIVLAKSNLHELCFGITSNNSEFGAVRNPYASERIAGGSSGGTAAAIAARLAPAGIGSDTGGSLRIPAALCGIVGFRPTIGRWPTDGVATLSFTRDTLGPMARQVTDCALLDAVVCDEPVLLPNLPLQGVRLGIPKKLFWEMLDPEIEAASHHVLSLLEKAGVVLVDCEFDFDEVECTQAGMVVAMYESLSCIEEYMVSHGLQFDAAKVASKISSPDVREIFEFLISCDAPKSQDYQNAMTVIRPSLQKSYASCFEKYNVQALIFPTTPLAAAYIGEDKVLLAGEETPIFPAFTRNVASGSFAGIPGISLPIGCNSLGLPMGIALDGLVGSDRHLLALAQSIQSLLPEMPSPPSFF